MLTKGSLSVRTFKRATALSALDRSNTLTAAAEPLDVDNSMAVIWRNTDRIDGLTFLVDAPRSGRPNAIAGAQRAKLTALACSTLPKRP
ncbi:MAG: hypothetical protein RMJ48_11270 [Roseiflexaceae bacterium]|nr:hypothetical protein [Roseiflexaceae bacterium]